MTKEIKKINSNEELSALNEGDLVGAVHPPETDISYYAFHKISKNDLFLLTRPSKKVIQHYMVPKKCIAGYSDGVMIIEAGGGRVVWNHDKDERTDLDKVLGRAGII